MLGLVQGQALQDWTYRPSKHKAGRVITDNKYVVIIYNYTRDTR